MVFVMCDDEARERVEVFSATASYEGVILFCLFLGFDV